MRSGGSSIPAASARLLAEVEERVLRERLQRVGDAALLLGERGLERGRVEHGPLGEQRPVPPDLAAVDAEEVAVRDHLEQRRAGASISLTPARTSSSGPGFGNRPVVDGATLTTARTPVSASSSAETRSRSAWSTIATSSGAEVLDEVLRPPPEARSPCQLSVHGRHRLPSPRRRTPRRRASARARRGARRRRARRSAYGSDRPAPSRPAGAGRRRSRSAAGA